MNPDLTGEKTLQKMFHRSVRYSFSGFFTVMLNTAVDGMIIGHFLGIKAMAAFGLIVPLYSLMNLIPVLLRSSTQLNVGADLGRGQPEEARRRIFQLLMTGLAAAVPFMLLFTVFRGSVVYLLCSFSSHAEDTVLMAEQYLLWLAPAMIPLMTAPVLHPVMQLDGDAMRSPLAIHAATVVNILGDILNALVFHGGMAGMALATVFSCYTELLVLLSHFTNKTSLLRPTPCLGLQKEWAMALSNGVPVMLHELTAFCTGIVINHYAFQFAGEDLVAAVAAGNSVWAFLIPGSLAASGAVMTLGSVCRGEADHKGGRVILLMGVWYALVPCSIYALIFAALADPMAELFSGGNEQLLQMALVIIRGFAVTLPLVAFCQVIESHLNIIGKKGLATIIGILEGGVSWIVFVCLPGWADPVSRIWAGRISGEFTVTLVIAVCLLFCLLKQRKSTTDNNGKGCSGYSELEATIHSVDEAVAFSESLRVFCINNNISSRISLAAALCAEEVACNTITWGYHGVPDRTVDMRAVCRGDRIILRFRDYGQRFDPKSYISNVLVHDKDPARNMGLKILSGLTSEIQYMCIVDCNVLLIYIIR